MAEKTTTATNLDNFSRPFDQKQVPFDKRDGYYANMGVDYGVGNRNPVGLDKVKKNTCMPDKAMKYDPYKKA